MKGWSVFRSSIGRKTLMALTGIVLIGFVLGHMLGNLQVFLGRDVLNTYAENLQKLGPVLWVIRAALLAAFVLHVYLGITLSLENKAARPVPYHHQHTEEATLASRYMFSTGLVILVFALYHLAHFTVGLIQHDSFVLTEKMADGRERHDVYRMVILGFRNPLVSISYIVAQIFLGVHLLHGGTSIFQSLGWKVRRFNGFIKNIGLGLALIVVLGNVAMPLAIVLDLIGTGGD